MQQKNVVVFVILSSLIIFGWPLVHKWVWPPPPRAPQQPAVKLPLESRQYADLYLHAPSAVVLAPAVPGVGSALHLLTEAGLAHPATPGPLRLALARKAEPKPRPTPEAVAARRPKVEPRTITLGDDSFNLKVQVTTHGAGVQSVVLNKFQAANAMGLPVWQDAAEKVPEPLELIPAEKNRFTPSNLLYQYDPPEGDRPADTLGDLHWSVQGVNSKKNEAGQEVVHEVVFACEVPGQDLVLTKTYTLSPGDYHVGLAVGIERKADGNSEPLKFQYQLTGGHGLPVEGDWYTYTYRSALVGLVDAKGSLWRDFQDAPTIVQKEGGDEVRRGDNFIQYAGIAVQYFASVIVAEEKQDNFLLRARATIETVPDPKKPHLTDLNMRVVSVPLELKPGAKVVHRYLLYNGPVKVHLLGQLEGDKAVAPELVQRYERTLHLNTLADYHSPGFMGEFFSKILWTNLIIFFTNLMHDTLSLLHNLVPYYGLNYGLCIILLTVLVRGLMFPISRKQALTSIKMQALAPEMKKLQEKYKTDLQARNQAVMELYRKHGVHPLGSCWILLLQMPIFLGLYYALQESIHFRLASFLWMDNLAAPDMLFWWGESIPFISRPEALGGFFYLGPFFNLLPVVAGGLMLVQQTLMMPPPTDEQQEMQQKIMKYMMIVMVLLFYKVAAGLAIYFIVSSLWGLVERKLLYPKKAPDGTNMAPAAKQPAGAASTAAARASKARGRRDQKDQKEESNGTLRKVRALWEEVLKQAKKK
jgi:YidC/Oxa1 family membrane protein insertase